MKQQDICLSETLSVRPLLCRFEAIYLTLTFHHSKYAAPWDTHACQIWSCYPQYCKSYGKLLKLEQTNQPTNQPTGQKQYVLPPIVEVEGDIEITRCLCDTQCPPIWRLTLTLHYSKCAAPWDTHACQISSCYIQYSKSYCKMLKLAQTNQPTDQPTDRAKTICPPLL
jgi:hypothetical protein